MLVGGTRSTAKIFETVDKYVGDCISFLFTVSLLIKLLADQLIKKLPQHFKETANFGIICVVFTSVK